MTSNATKSSKMKWIFWGNVVQPVGNPFDEKQQALFTESHDDDSDTIWLGPGLKILLDHLVVVDSSGQICTVEPKRTSNIDLNELTPECQLVKLSSPTEFLCPGMIDLHIHAPQFAYTGTATDRPLMGPDGWLEKYTFPAERDLKSDLPLAKAVYDGVVKATLCSGTTTAVYFATLHLEPCKILVDTVQEHGQRALVGKVCMDRNSPQDYCQTTDENVAETKELVEYIYSVAGKRESDTSLPLVLPLVTPRFIPTCTPELLTALGNLAKEENIHITSHISESLDEVEFSKSLHATDTKGNLSGDITDTLIFDSHNLLTDQCVMAHGVWMSDNDLGILKQRGTAVAHCPLSNFFFANGVLRCKQLMNRDNLVGLGTDVAGGYSPSMLDSCRACVVASRTLEHPVEEDQHRLDYRHAFYLATLGGARSLQLDDHLGNFEVGKQFDAFVFSTARNVPIFEKDTTPDIFQKLCNLGDDRNVRRVFVSGVDVTQE